MKQITILVVFVAFVALLTTGCQDSTADFNVGVATRDITLANQPVADPLLAKAMVFRQGKQKAALVICDQVFVSKDVTDIARKDASELTGIPFSNISIIATHTHNSRDRTFWRGLTKLGDELAKELAEDFDNLPAEEFSAKLSRKFIHLLGSKEVSDKEAKTMADNAAVDTAEELSLKIVDDYTKAMESKAENEAPEVLAEALHKTLKNELSTIRIDQFIDRVSKGYIGKSVSEVSASLLADLEQTLAKDIETKPTKEDVDRIVQMLADRKAIAELDEKLKKEIADNPVEMPADEEAAKELKEKQAKEYAQKRSDIIADMKVEKTLDEIDEILLRELFRKLNDQLSLIRAKEITQETGSAISPKDLEKTLTKELAKKRSTMLKSKISAAIRKHYQVQRVKELSHKMTFAIVEAYRNAKPVEINSAVGQLVGHAHNRRYFMEDGSIKYNPTVLQDGLVKHAGPVDEDFGFIMFTDAISKKPVTSLSNFAMHVCTIGPIETMTPDGREINTPDYPVYIEKALQKEFGKDFISLFGQGCCGDINHVDCFDSKSADGFAEAKRHGDAMAALILEELPDAKKVAQPSLAVLSEIVDLPYKTYTEEELAWAQGKPVDPELAKELDKHPAKRRAITRLADARKDGVTSLPVDVQVFRLSKDVAIVTFPGEIFVQFGMDIKAASPFATTLVIELSNTRKVGYVSSEAAEKQAEINSYKIETSKIGSEGGRAIANSAIRMLKELHADLYADLKM